MFARPLPPGSVEEIAARLGHRPGFFWLDGDCPEHAEAEWSFVGCDPLEQRRATLADADPFGVLPPARAGFDEPSPLEGAPRPAEVPSWVGYLAYDAHLCGRPQRLSRDAQQPVGLFARYPALLAVHRDGRGFVVGDDSEAVALLLSRAHGERVRTASTRLGPIAVAPAEQHRTALRRAFEHIAAGDIYQVNLARCFTASLGGDPLSLWLAMRRVSPVPLGFYLDDGYAEGGRVVMSRTMERFLRFECESRRLVTRPIKGTIARAGCSREEALRLQADPKERAEHAMIVDLMRNDLGRVAECGSVRVPEVMRVERFARLSHLVSTVECRVRPEMGIGEVLAATFPPGSVTGAPKLRAMEIIEALEASPRDAYTGALGFVDRTGGLSLAVGIRTAVAEAGRVRYWAGGGIVEASRIEAEIAETELKARVFLDAAADLSAELSLSSTGVLR